MTNHKLIIITMGNSAKKFATFLICIFLALLTVFEVSELYIFGLLLLGTALLPKKISPLFLMALSAFLIALLSINFNSRPPVAKSLDSSAVIVSEPQVDGRHQKFIIRTPENFRLLLITAQSPKFRYGQTLRVSGKPKPPEGGFDLVIKISGKLIYPQIYPQLKAPDTLVFRGTLIKFKQSLEASLGRAFSEPTAGLLRGIFFGTKAGLSEDFKTTLINSGTIHIIALSGFNITIIVYFFSFLFAFMPKKLGFLITSLAIIAFILATGLSASVIRAGIMGWVWLLGGFFGRQKEPLLAILFSATLMALLNPYILIYDVGFQLSFASFTGLIYLTPLLQKCFRAGQKIFMATLLSSLAVTAATWPILSYYFGRISLIAPVSNVFILPFLPLLMALGFASALTAQFAPKLSGFFLPWTQWLADYFFKCFNFFGNLPGVAINFRLGTFLFIISYYLLLFEAVYLIRRRIFWKKRSFLND